MGASLSVDLSQVSVNESSRTATVSIVVKITSTAGTHNHYGSSDLGQGALLYVTIDGNTYSQYVTFGSSSTGTYTSTVYSNSITVSYSSSGTKTVSASARCVTGTSAGTISGSDSLSLTPIGSSSGGSGGDSGDGGEEWEEGGSSGSDISGGNWYLVPGNTTVLGQGYQDTHSGTFLGYNTGHAFFGFVYNMTFYRYFYVPAVIKFRTPEFTREPSYIHVSLQFNGTSQNGSILASLCSSDANVSKYMNAGATVTDSYQISTGLMFTNISNKEGSIYEIEFPAKNIKSNTVYYLIVRIPSDAPSADQKELTVSDSNYHAINVVYVTSGTIHIDNGSSIDDYACYIHNGTSYVAYECYIDNGSDWDLFL